MLFASESSNKNAVPYERDTQAVVDQYGNTDGDVDKGILDTLDIHRGQHPDNTMVTEGFHALVRQGEHYTLTEDGLHREDHTAFPLLKDLSKALTLEPHTLPSHVEVQGTWDNAAVDAGIEANIFAKNGTFTVDTGHIDVPVVTASAETLAYYNAHYLQLDDGLQFGSEAPYPICVMTIGRHYVDDYLMHTGGGQYIEFHDRPHFHWNLDKNNSGYYLLGKKIGDNRYHLTGFSIPYGAAVYTMPSALHADANLVGTNWLVGLTVAPHFSTVLFRSADNVFTKLNFKRD